MPTAENDAKQLLRQVWTPDDPSEIRLPVDPFYIAKALGIGVFLDPNLPDDVSGKLQKRSGYDAAIYLNPNDSRNRQRFTCAHELGHYNKRSQQRDFGDFEYVDLRGNLAGAGTSPDEVYANQFAASLLMPQEAVKSVFRESNEVTALAARFGVSADAMAFRLKNLGLG